MDPEIAAAITGLGTEAEHLLRSLLSPGERCALLDFPNYPNIGDSAIWLGERTLLRRVGVRVVYASDLATFRPSRLRSSVRGGTILLQGGGNLGDVWPDLQEFRETVIRTFPDLRIIQLPQSIHFDDQRCLDRARRVFDAHPRLTLLVRDKRSLEVAREAFAAEVTLCPDMVFGLGPLALASPPRDEVVSLLRQDKEAAEGSAARRAARGHVEDWGEDDPSCARWRGRTQKYLRPEVVGPLWSGMTHIYDILARRRLRTGIRLLSRGRVVFTDRLHGHILSLLLGIPHVAMDNSYGKVFGCLETWTGQLPLVRWANTVEQAREQLDELVREARR